jgi:hypothetical protein
MFYFCEWLEQLTKTLVEQSAVWKVNWVLLGKMSWLSALTGPIQLNILVANIKGEKVGPKQNRLKQQKK